MDAIPDSAHVMAMARPFRRAHLPHRSPLCLYPRMLVAGLSLELHAWEGRYGGCCSQYSYCGSTGDYCSAENRCQVGHGKCNPVSSLSRSSTRSSTMSASHSSSTRALSSTSSSSPSPSPSASSSSLSAYSPPILNCKLLNGACIADGERCTNYCYSSSGSISGFVRCDLRPHQLQRLLHHLRRVPNLRNHALLVPIVVSA